MATYEPTTNIEKFAVWLDTTPRYTWEMVERAAQLHSIHGGDTFDDDTARGGICQALGIMSGFRYDVIARFVRDFAADNYDYGERIY